MLVAFVDVVEGRWAAVELRLDEHLMVLVSRLPEGVREGDALCYCDPVRGTYPPIFRTCPDDFFREQKI